MCREVLHSARPLSLAQCGCLRVALHEEFVQVASAKGCRKGSAILAMRCARLNPLMTISVIRWASSQRLCDRRDVRVAGLGQLRVVPCATACAALMGWCGDGDRVLSVIGSRYASTRERSAH